MITPRCIWPCNALLGEGPVWDPRDDALYFVDIKRPALHRLGLRFGRRDSWPMPEPICWIVPRKHEPGFIAGFKSGFAELWLDPLRIKPIGNPEPDLPGNRLNDAKVDSSGRLWAGSMDDAEKRPSGKLYRLDHDRTWACVDEGYGVANGPTFSPDGRTLYHADSAARLVYEFDIDQSGWLSNRRVFVRFEEAWGYPDGMTTDSEGGVWIAHWDGGRISRFLPDGRLERSIPLPVSRPTSCAFAGAHGERMFVTSASIERHTEILAGAVFEVFPEVSGLPSFGFAG